MSTPDKDLPVETSQQTGTKLHSSPFFRFLWQCLEWKTAFWNYQIKHSIQHYLHWQGADYLLWTHWKCSSESHQTMYELAIIQRSQRKLLLHLQQMWWTEGDWETRKSCIHVWCFGNWFDKNCWIFKEQPKLQNTNEPCSWFSKTRKLWRCKKWSWKTH